MQYLECALALFPLLAAAVPAPKTTTAAPGTTPTPAAAAPPLTLAPGFTVTSTVIDGSTYPIFAAGGQGGYEFTATSFSATGLLGITLANNYSTLPGGQVYPVYDIFVNEADSELFTIPGVLTFRDGGLSTSFAQSTDVMCSVGTNGGGCEGLIGLVSGEVLGTPFTNVGGLFPTLSLPASSGGSFVGALSGSAFIQGGPLSETGAIGGAIVTAPSFTSAGVFATGGGDNAGGAIVASGTSAALVGDICETKVLGVCTTATVGL